MPKENGTKRKGTRVTRPFGHLARCKICREFENSLTLRQFKLQIRQIFQCSASCQWERNNAASRGYQCRVFWTRVVTK